MRAILVWAVAFGILAVYPVAAFYPFAFIGPQVFANGAEIEDRAANFAHPGMLVSPAPPDLLRGIAVGIGFAFELVVVPDAVDQHGPAHILTIRNESGSANLSVGQNGDALVVRSGMRKTSANGLPSLVVPAVFHAGLPQRITIKAAGDGTLMTLQVSLDKGRRIIGRLDMRSFADRAPGKRLALGNAFDAPRPWLGTIHTARIVTDGTTIDYLAPGRLDRPRYLWYPRDVDPWFLMVSGGVAEAAMNLLGFMPLELVLAALVSTWLGCAMALVVGASMVIETGQYFTPTRFPSAADLLLNIAGGALCIAVFIIVRRRWPGLWQAIAGRPI